MINSLIGKLLDDVEPYEIELMEAFDEIFSGVCDEIPAVSFVTLLKEKEDLFRAKSNCLSCAIKSARSSVSKITVADNFPAFETVQFAETPEYFDISFVMDIILASNDILVSKYAFPCQNKRSFETLRSFGANVCEIGENFGENFEKSNFIYVNLSENEPYYKYTNNILRKLPFENVLKIAENFLNPVDVKNQFMGVKNKSDVEKYANVCLNIGNANSLILSSNNELPFASIDGETYIAEAWKNKIFTYALTPELIGLVRYPLKDLKSDSIEHNRETISNLFENKEKGAFYEFSVLNSALALYIVKKANSIMDGIKLAQKTIDSGLAKEKLNQIQKLFS